MFDKHMRWIQKGGTTLNSIEATAILYRRFVARTYLPCWVLKARIQKHRGKPFLFQTINLQSKVKLF